MRFPSGNQPFDEGKAYEKLMKLRHNKAYRMRVQLKEMYMQQKERRAKEEEWRGPAWTPLPPTPFMMGGGESLDYEA